MHNGTEAHSDGERQKDRTWREIAIASTHNYVYCVYQCSSRTLCRSSCVMTCVYSLNNTYMITHGISYNSGGTFPAVSPLSASRFPS